MSTNRLENTVAEYIADFAPKDLPDIDFFKVDQEQMLCINKAMLAPGNDAKFEITMLPIETAEQRQAAAEEWAGYHQAAMNTKTRDMGAFLLIDGRDRSPNYYREVIEGNNEFVRIPFAPFVACAVAKVIKLADGADTYDLMREYYEPTE